MNGQAGGGVGLVVLRDRVLAWEDESTLDNGNCVHVLDASEAHTYVSIVPCVMRVACVDSELSYVCCVCCVC